MGRSLDINNLVSQRVNTQLKRNLDFAVSKYEADDLSAILDLDTMLDNLRMMHALLSDDLSVDGFEELV